MLIKIQISEDISEDISNYKCSPHGDTQVKKSMSFVMQGVAVGVLLMHEST